MPTISRKGIDMPSSPIRKLVPYAEAAKKRGIHVHHLNIGQPDIDSPVVAMNAVKNTTLKVLEYSHSAGFESYREKLAVYYQNVGGNITSDDIIVTTGGSEALLFALMTCFDPGDEIIIPEPFYANYNSFALMAGVKVIPLRSKIEDSYALPSLENFKKAIGPKTKGILLCNPGNPTGYVYTKAELLGLEELALEYDLYVIADEVYREFCYGGLEPFSCLRMNKIEQNVIIIDSVSKRFSMCGARVGALVTTNKKILATAMKFAQARLSPPTLAQIAAEAALGCPQRYFDEVNDEYDHRRKTLVNGLNAIEGVLCPMPKGAFYCMARLPIKDSDHFCQWMLESFSYEGQTVMMAPATGFYASQGAGADEVRLAYVLNEKDLIASVEIIKRGLAAYPGV